MESVGAPWHRSAGAALLEPPTTRRMLVLGCKITDRKAKHHVVAPYSDRCHASVDSELLEEAGNLLCLPVSEGFVMTFFADVMWGGGLTCGTGEMQGNHCTLWSEALHWLCFAVWGELVPCF